jgi:DNA modification methylase
MSKLSDDFREGISTRGNQNPLMEKRSPWKTVHYGCSTALESIETGSTDVVVISSRFDGDDKRNIHPQQFELSENSRALLTQAIRVLKRGGLLFIYGLPKALPYWGRRLMLAPEGDARMEFKYWIALDIDNSERVDFLVPSHMGLLLFAKVPLKGRDKYPVFLNTRAVRVPHRFCAACKQNVKDYGGKKHLMNPLGAALSDVWRDLSKTSIRSNRIPSQVLDRVFALTAKPGSKQVHIVQSDKALRVDKPVQLGDSLSGENGIAFENLESNQVYSGDCCSFLRRVCEVHPQGIFDMAFADPPYNLSKGYNDYEDSLADKSYLDWCNRWLAGMAKSLRPGGSLFVLNLPKWALHHAAFLNGVLEFRHWIAWDALSDPRGKLMPAHYALLYYTKPGGTPTFNYNALNGARTADAVNPPVSPQYCLRASCIKRRNQISADERVELSDIWFDIHRIKHKRDRDAHPCQLPEKLMERLITLATKEGDIVFDPFCGAGTTAIAAHKLKRRFAVIDLDEKYVHITQKKLAQMEETESQFGVPFVPRSSTRKVKRDVSKKEIETYLQALAKRLRREPSEQDIQAARPDLLAAIDRIYPSRMAAIKRSRIVLGYASIRTGRSRSVLPVSR